MEDKFCILLYYEASDGKDDYYLCLGIDSLERYNQYKRDEKVNDNKVVINRFKRVGCSGGVRKYEIDFINVSITPQEPLFI